MQLSKMGFCRQAHKQHGLTCSLERSHDGGKFNCHSLKDSHKQKFVCSSSGLKAIVFIYKVIKALYYLHVTLNNTNNF